MSLVDISLDIVGMSQGKRGTIYFIQMDSIGPIKIGYTKNFKNRIRSLKTSIPYELNVLYKTKGTQKEESELHNLFRCWNIRGEWFHPTENIKKYIEDCKEFDERIETRKKRRHGANNDD